MRRSRARKARRGLAILTLAASLSLVAFAALDRPVRAADDAAAAAAVAAMEAAGMDCTSGGGVTHCDFGADCGPDGKVCDPNDDGLPWGTGSIYPDPTSGTPIISLTYTHQAVAPDKSGARPLFEAVTNAVCPSAAAGASGWFSNTETFGSFPGDGCGVLLTSGSDANGAEVTQTYSMNFDLNSLVVPIASASSGPAAPSATTSAVVPTTTPTDAAVGAPVATSQPPADSSGGAVIPPGGFVASITTPSQMTMDPTVAIQSAVLAILILLLMPFPAQLFNSTVEEHDKEIRGWFAPLTRSMRTVGSGIGAFWRSPVGIVSFLVVSALLYALLDPTFAFSLDGLITIVGILLGLVVVTALFSVPAVLWHRRRGDHPVIEAIPFTLLIAVVCVAISRLADFQPGYLYGLIIGLGFARTLDPSGEGRSGAAAAALMLVSALLAWLGLGLMVDAGIQGFVGVFIATILAAVMVAGLEGVAFGLMPIRSLPGEPIYAWNRLAWGALIFTGLFAFMHILINPQSGYLSDSSRTPLFTMLALLIGFGVASVAFWGYFRFRPEPVEA